MSRIADNDRVRPIPDILDAELTACDIRGKALRAAGAVVERPMLGRRR